ncbi:unnamed protein product, partial [Urochloa humidicola]
HSHFEAEASVLWETHPWEDKQAISASLHWISAAGKGLCEILVRPIGQRELTSVQSAPMNYDCYLSLLSRGPLET